MRQWVGFSSLISMCFLTTTNWADEKPAALPPKPASIAQIKLSGSMDESPVAEDPLFGSSPENFRSRLDRIKKAAKDPSIKALYLHVDGVTCGWGKLDEFTRALADFRKTGKPTIAYVESGETKDYLIGLACDKVVLPEAGWLMLTGVRAEVTMYKEMFDKIGVKADFLQMGAFKGAAEPYTRSKLSAENRAQLESMIGDFFEQGLVNRLLTARKKQNWTPEQVSQLIDQGPFTARQAVKLGLADATAYPGEVEDLLKKSLAVETVKVVKDYGKSKPEEMDLSNPFALLKMLKPQTPKVTKSPKIAVIHAIGAINTGKGGKSLMGESTVGSTTMIEAIRQAEEDTSVKAIVLRVDSPGGSALASDLIWNELKKSKKPIIASMSDVAASGGYYISMAAEKIYAEPGTITGSIGVVGGKLTLGGTWDKVGLNTEVIKRGAHAGILSTDTPFSPTERETFRKMMEDIYDQFLTKALEGRKKAGVKMSREQLEKLASGRVWTGRQAKANGLIDELGTLQDAIAYAWKQAKQPSTIEPELLMLPRPKPVFDELLESFGELQSPMSQLRQIPGVRELGDRLAPAANLMQMRGEPVWVVMPFSLQVR